MNALGMQVHRHDDAQEWAREHAELLDVLCSPLKDGPMRLYMLLWSRRTPTRDDGWKVTLSQVELAKALHREDTTFVRRCRDQLKATGLISLLDDGDWRIVWWRECGKLADGLSVEEGDPQRELFDTDEAVEEAGDEVTGSLASSAAGAAEEEHARRITMALAAARGSRCESGKPLALHTDAARGSPGLHRSDQAIPRSPEHDAGEWRGASRGGENAGENAGRPAKTPAKTPVSNDERSESSLNRTINDLSDDQRSSERRLSTARRGAAAAKTPALSPVPSPLAASLGAVIERALGGPAVAEQAGKIEKLAAWMYEEFGRPADWAQSVTRKIARSVVCGQVPLATLQDVVAWAQHKARGPNKHAPFTKTMLRILENAGAD